MQRRVSLRWSDIAGVLLVALSICVLLWHVWPRTVVEAVDIASPTSVESSVTDELSPHRQSASRSQSPTPTPSLLDPRGELRALTVTHQGQTKPYIAMRFAPRVDDGGDFTSQCGKVAHWDVPGAARPGEESEYIALITGHVMCGPTHYSIENIKHGRKGDVLRVLYSSGDVVVMRARSDVDTVKKAELNKDRSRTDNRAPARTARLSTCDRSLPLRADGHSDYSYYMLFDRFQQEP